MEKPTLRKNDDRQKNKEKKQDKSKSSCMHFILC